MMATVRMSEAQTSTIKFAQENASAFERELKEQKYSFPNKQTGYKLFSYLQYSKLDSICFLSQRKDNLQQL